MVDIKAFVGFPGPVGPGTSYSSGHKGKGDGRVEGESSLTEWVFICGSNNVFEQRFLFSKNIGTERLDVLVRQLFRIKNGIGTVEHFWLVLARVI